MQLLTETTKHQRGRSESPNIVSQAQSRTSDSRYTVGDLSDTERSGIADSDRRRPWKSAALRKYRLRVAITTPPHSFCVLLKIWKGRERERESSLFASDQRWAVSANNIVSSWISRLNLGISSHLFLSSLASSRDDLSKGRARLDLPLN